MAKVHNLVTLGKRPRVFKQIDVAVTLPDGEAAVIPVTFKYRTRQEFGRWLDQSIALAKAKVTATETATDDGADAASDEPKAFSWEQFYQDNAEAAVAQLLDAVDSWGLEFPCDAKHLLQLSDEVPGAIAALNEAYGRICREGRLGN